MKLLVLLVPVRLPGVLTSSIQPEERSGCFPALLGVANLLPVFGLHPGA